MITNNRQLKNFPIYTKQHEPILFVIKKNNRYNCMLEIFEIIRLGTTEIQLKYINNYRLYY